MSALSHWERVATALAGAALDQTGVYSWGLLMAGAVVITIRSRPVPC